MEFLSHRKQFPIFALLLMVLFTALIFALSIHAADNHKRIAASTPKGQILYTQYSLFYERNQYLTTNYLRGTLLPVNTEVKFVASDRSAIRVTLPGGQDLAIKNIREFSGENIDGIFTRTFADNPIDLSQFTEDEKKAILLGQVKIGMRKSAVIAAIGYPPKHKTPGLELNQWRYWQNRFNTIIVFFENDKVTLINN